MSAPAPAPERTAAPHAPDAHVPARFAGVDPDLAVAAGRVAHERHGRQRRAFLVTVTTAVLLFAGLCVSLAVGPLTIPLVDVVPALFGSGQRAVVFVLQDLRLPRALGAVLVGAALAMSGSIFQTMTRNPLASPDILGITQVAGCAAAFAILVLGAGAPVVAGFALGGGLLAALLVYVLSWRRGGTSGNRIVLVGIGVSAVGSAATSWLLTQREALEAQRALVWITGSLNDVSGRQVLLLAVVLAVAAVVLPLARTWLAALELGDDTATGLGLPVEKVRGLVVLLGVVLAASAVAVGGPIVFVALVSAPIARRLARTPGLVPLLSGLVGGVLLLVSDNLGRYLLDNQPVGVVTGIVGAPYLIWLLTRRDTWSSHR